MNTFDFVNEETGVPFRVRVVRRGESYGRGAILRKNESLVEFYERRRTTDPNENGQFVANYFAWQFLRTNPGGLKLGMAQSLWKITEKNCDQIAHWLAGEIDKPWVPPPNPPRPLPNTPTGPIGASKRKITIYIGTKKHEATWMEVVRRNHAQFKDAYFIRFIPKRARLVRECIGHLEPNAVIVEGWGHPDFSIMRDLLETATASITIGAKTKDLREMQLARYLEGLPISRILLDTRGVIVEEG